MSSVPFTLIGQCRLKVQKLNYKWFKNRQTSLLTEALEFIPPLHIKPMTWSEQLFSLVLTGNSKDLCIIPTPFPFFKKVVPVVQTLSFHCRGHRFDSWLGK